MTTNKTYCLAGLACLLVVASWYVWGTRPSVVEAGIPKGARAPVRGCGAPGMLNVIVQGPFVLDNNSGEFVVLGPDVHVNHDLPLLIDRKIVNPRGIQPGEYSLSVTDQQSGDGQICNPVAGTDLLMIPAKTESLKSDPNGLHSFTVQLPKPAEIVPWNADPMQISTEYPIPSGAKIDRFAPMVVLRYKYTAGGPVTFAGSEKATGKKVSYDLTPLLQGAENFVAIVQLEHEDDDPTHPYAHDAFDKMQALEPQLKRYVAFPAVSGAVGKNTPLITGMEPTDLTDFLSSYGATDKASLHRNNQRSRNSAGTEHMMINHNDCKAAMIFADYTQ